MYITWTRYIPSACCAAMVTWFTIITIGTSAHARGASGAGCALARHKDEYTREESDKLSRKHFYDQCWVVNDHGFSVEEKRERTTDFAQLYLNEIWFRDHIFPHFPLV